VKPLLWQLKQGAPASCPSYSRLRKQQLGLDHVTALKGIGKRSVGGGGDSFFFFLKLGGDSWDKKGK
jgi:transcription initiation factor TFIIB